MTLGPTSPTTNRLPAQPYEYVAAAKQAPAPAAAARRRRTRGVGEPSPAGKFWIYLLLVAGAALLLIPFVFMVLSSVKTEAEVAAGSFELPDKVLLRNYPDALRKMGFLPALANTVVITTMCVVGQVISSSLVGFGFARFKFRGRDALFLVMLSTMMLPAQVTMIPVFVLFRYLGWIDSFWPLIVPQWLAAPFFVFMFR